MKRSLLLLFVLLAFSSLFARTQPGKSSFAARVTNFGNEFGFGRMISPTAMVLVDTNLEFVSQPQVKETSAAALVAIILMVLFLAGMFSRSDQTNG